MCEAADIAEPTVKIIGCSECGEPYPALLRRCPACKSPERVPVQICATCRGSYTGTKCRVCRFSPGIASVPHTVTLSGVDLRAHVNRQIERGIFTDDKKLGTLIIEAALWNASSDGPDENCSFLWRRRDELLIQCVPSRFGTRELEVLKTPPRTHADRVPRDVLSTLSASELWHSVMRVQLLIDGFVVQGAHLEWEGRSNKLPWPETELAIWPYVRMMVLKLTKHIEAAVRKKVKRLENAERERQRANSANGNELAERPNVSAAAKRHLLSLYGEHIEYVRDAIQFADFHRLLDQNLGVQHNSATIETNCAMMADKLLKTAAREKVRAVYLANKAILSDTYQPNIFEEHLHTMLNEFAALGDFQQASESLIATITGMADRLRPAYDARIAKEQHELELRRTEEERLLAEERDRRAQELAEQTAREREAKIRTEIEQCIRAEAGGQNMSEDGIQREVELRMARWSLKNRRE